MTVSMLKMYNNFSKVVNFEQLPDPTDVWELGPVIGEGTYGEVFKGFNKKTGNEQRTLREFWTNCNNASMCPLTQHHLFFVLVVIIITSMCVCVCVCWGGGGGGGVANLVS